MDVVDLPLARMRPSFSARPLRKETIPALIESIRELGILHPLRVRAKQISENSVLAPGWEIIAGRHRYEAAYQMNLPTVPCVIETDEGLRAELMVIDENLIRAELTDAQAASAYKRRKEIYVELYPETRQHVAGGKARQDSASDKMSFAESTAIAIGKSERTIQRNVHRGEILEDDLDDIVGTSLDSCGELDALMKMPAAARKEIIQKAKAGEIVSVKTEAKKVQREAKEAALGARQQALPDKKYGVILADPAWQFEVYSRDSGLDRAADNHYPTSETDIIATRDIATIAAAIS